MNLVSIIEAWRILDALFLPKMPQQNCLMKAPCRHPRARLRFQFPLLLPLRIFDLLIMFKFRLTCNPGIPWTDWTVNISIISCDFCRKNDPSWTSTVYEWQKIRAGDPLRTPPRRWCAHCTPSRHRPVSGQLGQLGQPWTLKMCCPKICENNRIKAGGRYANSI